MTESSQDPSGPDPFLEGVRTNLIRGIVNGIFATVALAVLIYLVVRG